MKKFLLFIGDVLILYFSLVLTLYLRYEANFWYQLDLHLIPFAILFAVWILVFYIANLYDIVSLKNTDIFYSTLLRTILIASTISIIFFYLFPIYGITPKTNLLVFIIFFSIIELGMRSLFNHIFQSRFKKKVMIVGLNPQSVELAQFLRENPQLGYRIKYIVNINNDHKARLVKSRDFLITNGIEKLNEVVEKEEMDVIVISPEAYQIPEIINILYKLINRAINFYNLSSFYERVTGRVPLGAINQIWFLENLSEHGKKTYETTKRMTDTLIAFIGGVISLILYPFIILAIKIDSQGPVFYRQKRVGCLGKPFQIIKFRTMEHEAEKHTGPVWALENDQRVTKVGRFLRRTRLDELPQLWNIISGKMSLVGPRAERPEFHIKLQNDIPFYEERYLIKPGLTGWAQINYGYGASVKDTAQKLQYDLYYIKNRSMLLDLGIILKTIRIALQQAGR